MPALLQRAHPRWHLRQMGLPVIGVLLLEGVHVGHCHVVGGKKWACPCVLRIQHVHIVRADVAIPIVVE